MIHVFAGRSIEGRGTRAEGERRAKRNTDARQGQRRRRGYMVIRRAVGATTRREGRRRRGRTARGR
jgi:hypothetical protein